MAGPGLPTSGITSGTTTGHITHTYAIHGIVNELDTAIGTATTGDVLKFNGSVYAPAAETAGASLNATGDRILYVSKTGSDSNTGRSWASAYLTIGAAITAMSTNRGTIYVGAGTFAETLTWSGAIKIVGVGPYGTFIQLAANGTLIDFDAKNDIELSDICLTFASSSVSGTLMRCSNSFKHKLTNVRFLGQDGAAQIGLDILANAGDCHYQRCKFESLGIGVRTVSSISYFSHCQFSSNLTGILGGDQTGADARGGIVVTHSTFLGSGDYYIDIDGVGLNFFFSHVWFDGTADVAVKVGKADFSTGPRYFSLTHCPSLFGLLTSLVLNKATRVNLDAIQFHHGGGTPPTELSIPSPTNVPKGSIRNVRSNQSLKPHSLVPAAWDGYQAPFTYDSNKTQGVQTSVLADIGTDQVFKRVVIRISGRLSGDAQTVITFPTAFASTTTMSKTTDTTGFAGTTLAAGSLTIPTGVAGTGLIIIEGW